MTRVITFLSCGRSDYDLIYPIVKAVHESPGARAEIVLGGSNLSPFHGEVGKQIEADGFSIRGRVESLLASESWAGRSLSFCMLSEGLTRLLADGQRPDVVCVAGDREEALAGALVGNFLRIPVAHFYGGDRCIASDIDEVFRPAISKLAHWHFTATEGHRERLIKMGELPEFTWAYGSPGLDTLKHEPEVSDEELTLLFGEKHRGPFFLLIQHPSSTLGGDSGQAGEEMRLILDAVLSSGIPVFCSLPNTDPGNLGMRLAIEEKTRESDRLVTYSNLPRSVFVTLYRKCAAILGNSSSLIYESTFLKRPAVLIGPRQDLRERAANVLAVPVDASAIAGACDKVLHDRQFLGLVANTRSLYGEGDSARLIAKRLIEQPISRELLNKTIPY